MGNVRCDSRLVRPGDTFVAVPGVKADGINFVPAAIAAGAGEIVAEVVRPESGVPDSILWRTVPNARVELASLACNEFGNPSHKLDIFGITGTNGKTSTTMLLRDILEYNAFKPGFISTNSIEIKPRALKKFNPTEAVDAKVEENTVTSGNTTPGPLNLQYYFSEMLRNSCKTAVMEVSSHALDQNRTWGTRFAVKAFTNLTQDHLDYHCSMAEYYQVKKSFFIPSDAPSVINIDDSYGRQLFKEVVNQSKYPTISVGESADAIIRFSNVKLSRNHTSFLLSYPGGSEMIDIKLLGRHNIYNVVTAFSMALAYGIKPEKISHALVMAEPVRGRLELVQVKNCEASFFIDYAHTPDAIKNVLDALREITKGRLIIVFGAGGDRDHGKRPLMGSVANQLADICIITSDNPRSEKPLDIINNIVAGIPGTSVCGTADAVREVYIEPDRRAAIRLAASLTASPDDVVLIAGKGHETYQIFADRTEHFDDREELLSI